MTDLQKPVRLYDFDPHKNTDRSQRWFDKAQRYLAGGISSSARATSTCGQPFPLYMKSGSGSHIVDVDGNTFIDYLMSYGSLLLGHAHPAIRTALNDQITRGTMFGTCNTHEVELAKLICRLVPCAELVRYANSGSEAICGAIRAARGYTGRNRILKFEGHYHGWVDVLAVSNRPDAQQAGPLEQPNSQPHSRGIPSGVVEDVVICPWNRPDLLRAILDREQGQIAAVIAEPIVANNACIMPQEGYLETLRKECTQRGIVLIFDEIVTGFRVAPGGAQQLFGVEPDIAVFSKALGGGLPLSAFAGRREIMKHIAENTVKHGGTYNGNPLCASASRAVLEMIAYRPVLDNMDKRGRQIMTAIERAAADHHIPCVVQGTGAMFQVVFTDRGEPLRHYRDLLAADHSRHRQFRHALLRRGLLMNESSTACWFISASHTQDDIDATVEAIESAFAEMA